MNYGITRVPCHIEDLDAWPTLLRAPTQLSSIDSRHDDIRQQKIHLRCILHEDGQGGLRAGSRKHTVVQIPQKIGHIRAQVRIIFDDENGLHPLTFGKGFFGIAFGRTGIPIVTGKYIRMLVP